MTEKLKKINSKIQIELSYVILEKYPQYIFSITDISTDSDLETSEVFIAVSEDADKLVDLLNKNSRSIRYELAKRINFRKTPNLKFYTDNSGDNYNRISELLSKIPD